MNQDRLDRIHREAKRIKWWVIGCTAAVVFVVSVTGFVVVGAVSGPAVLRQ